VHGQARGLVHRDQRVVLVEYLDHAVHSVAVGARSRAMLLL
jgi:hypothetical protein